MSKVEKFGVKKSAQNVSRNSPRKCSKFLAKRKYICAECNILCLGRPKVLKILQLFDTNFVSKKWSFFSRFFYKKSGQNFATFLTSGGVFENLSKVAQTWHPVPPVRTGGIPQLSGVPRQTPVSPSIHPRPDGGKLSNFRGYPARPSIPVKLPPVRRG